MAYLDRLNSPSQYSMRRLLYYLIVKPQLSPPPILHLVLPLLLLIPYKRFHIHCPVTLTPLSETFSLPSTSCALRLLHSAKLDHARTASEPPLVRKPPPNAYDSVIILPCSYHWSFAALCSICTIGDYLYCGQNHTVESLFLPVGGGANYTLAVAITVENVEGQKINTILSVQVCTQIYYNL